MNTGTPNTPICVGPPIIRILAAEGQWVSMTGNAVIAADGLFRQDPYEKIERLENELAAVTAERDALKLRLTEVTHKLYPFLKP